MIDEHTISRPTAPRKERRDAAEHRQIILTTARALFGAQGVDATSMHEIARAAGVGQGTLYRRYAHKGALCMALLDQNMQSFRVEVEAHLASDATLALDQLEFILARLLAFNEANAPLLGAIGDAACGSRRSEVYQSPLYVWMRATALGLMRRAVAQGETTPLDVDATVDAVLATLSIDLYLYQRHTLGYTTEQIGLALCRLLFGGLRGRSPHE